MRHSQRRQDDVNRRAIRQEGHIFDWQDARDDALVAVTPGHFVANADLALLGNADPHDNIHTIGHFVASFTSEYLDIDNFAAFTMGHTQRAIFDFAGLFAEDGA